MLLSMLISLGSLQGLQLSIESCLTLFRCAT